MTLTIGKPEKFYSSSHLKNSGSRGSLLTWCKRYTPIYDPDARRMRSTEAGACAIAIYDDLVNLASGGPNRGEWVGTAEDFHLVLGYPVEIVERSFNILLAARWLREVSPDILTCDMARRDAPADTPLPLIEEASIYELAAARMMAMYEEAGAAEAGRMCSDDALIAALVDVCQGPNEAKLLAKIEANLETHIEAASKPEMLLSLNRWPRDPRALAEPVKRAKKYKRGSTEALAVGEYQAGRMTAEQLQEMGIAV